MKIAILSHGDNRMDRWKKISFENKEKYCDKNGYDFIGSDKVYDDRPPQWSKLLMVREYLPSYDWVMWNDPDTLIMNTEIKLEEFIDNDFDFIAAKFDYINMGVFFVKNSAIGLKIINDIYNQDQYIGLAGNDESAAKHLLGTKEYIDIVRENIKLINNASFNKMPDKFQLGDFIIHFPGHYKDYKYFKKLSQGIKYHE